METWSALKSPGRQTAALILGFIKHSGPAPADDIATQIITDSGNFTLDFKNLGFCAFALFLQTRAKLQIAKGFWTNNNPAPNHLYPGRMLLLLFLAREWFDMRTFTLYCLCLCVMDLDALTPASVHSLWGSPKFLNQLLTILQSRLMSSLLIVHVLPSSQLPNNMFWYVSLCQPAFPAMCVSVALPSMRSVWIIIFWTNVESAVFSMIVAVCTEIDWEIHGVNTDWIVIYSNSRCNILLFWDGFF